MLELLKERKAQLEAEGKKGFTLMEMLIVIAIIAVLIAIAIPVFTSQLEVAREGTDAANLRAKYAEVVADNITNSTKNTDGTDKTYTVTLRQTQDGWQDQEFAGQTNWPENMNMADFAPEAGKTVTLTYSNGTVTLTQA